MFNPCLRELPGGVSSSVLLPLGDSSSSSFVKAFECSRLLACCARAKLVDRRNVLAANIHCPMRAFLEKVVDGSSDLCSFCTFSDVWWKVACSHFCKGSVSRPEFTLRSDPNPWHLGQNCSDIPLYSIFVNLSASSWVCACFVHVESVTIVTTSRPEASDPPSRLCNSRSPSLFAAEASPFALSAEREPAATLAEYF